MTSPVEQVSNFGFLPGDLVLYDDDDNDVVGHGIIVKLTSVSIHILWLDEYEYCAHDAQYFLRRIRKPVQSNDAV